jgi:hypothetical protein
MAVGSDAGLPLMDDILVTEFELFQFPGRVQEMIMFRQTVDFIVQALMFARMMCATRSKLVRLSGHAVFSLNVRD